MSFLGMFKKKRKVCPKRTDSRMKRRKDFYDIQIQKSGMKGNVPEDRNSL